MPNADVAPMALTVCCQCDAAFRAFGSSLALIHGVRKFAGSPRHPSAQHNAEKVQPDQRHIISSMLYGSLGVNSIAKNAITSTDIRQLAR